MAAFVRGSTVFFTATCLDASGAPVTPNSANLYLVYTALAGGGRTKVTVAMSVAGNVVSATWDSSVAADGTLAWSIRAVGSDTIVLDGSLVLTANAANSTS